jgi:hypothetical protein
MDNVSQADMPQQSAAFSSRVSCSTNVLISEITMMFSLTREQ